MKIELKELKVSAALSQETTAYTAVIHIDGAPAFHASNRGHGGADEFDAVRDYSGPGLKAVDDWLAVNEPPSGPFEADPAKRTPWDCGSKCDLEMMVARLIDRHEAEKRLRRLLKSSIVRIGEDGQIYKLAMKPTDAGIAMVRQTHPTWVIVNSASSEIIDQALTILCGSQDNEQSVYARQRANRLTLEDARWLRERNNKADKPCPDLHAFLSGLIEKEQVRLNRYRADREAEHQARITAEAVSRSNAPD
ncbi:hypothetical protein [Pseudomonas sp.]|uniref:hypothetical protein n=1 Tax=Pseudomonas sp. TaxID=306 RepID=UPI003D142DCB